MEEEKQLVEPGFPLAYSEEFLPGDGTYDDGTQIRAALYGLQRVDPKTMTLSVRPASKGVAEIKKGDIVVGQITYMKPDLASVKILAVRGKEDRVIHQLVEGTLHASKIDNRYVDAVADEFSLGDIIRAKVIGLKGGPQLATDKPEYGTIKAFSRNDPTRTLERQGNKLVDPEDGHTETRKLADDYGSGVV